MTQADHRLEKQLNEVTETIKAYRRNCTRQWYQLQSRHRPWILLIGPESADKTAWLATSSLSLHSPHHKAITSNDTPHLFNFWVHPQAVLIDVAPALLEPTDATQALWQRFYALSRRYFLDTPIHNILLTLDLPTLVDPQKREALLSEVLHTLQLFNDTKVSVTGIVTQCGQLTGFNEYFSHLSREERQQPFGVTLPDTADSIEAFHKYFQTLVKTTNDQLLLQLHQNQDLKHRGSIQNFPLQFEKLGEHLQSCVDAFVHEKNLHLNGIYFTHHGPQTEKIDLVSHAIHEKLQWEDARKSTDNQPPDDPLFLSGLLHRVVSRTRTRQIRSQQKRRWMVVPLLLLTVALGVFFFKTNYEEDASRLALEEKTLTQQSAAVTDWLSRLDTLSKTAAIAERDTYKTHRLLGQQEAQRISAQAKKAYEHVLITALKPYVLSTLESHLEHALNSGDKVDLYNTLRAYLSLVNQAHGNSRVVIEWFKATWRQQYSRYATLTTHLQALLTLESAHWTINNTLVSNAREQLQQLPLADLAFLKLQGLYHNDMPISLAAKQIKGLDLTQTQLPALYSTEHYNKIINETIPQLARALALGDWVVGTSENTPSITLNETQLVSELRAIYRAYYQQERLAILPKIQLLPPKNFAELYRAISLVSEKNSPLLALLRRTLKSVSAQSQVLAFAEGNDTYYRIHYALSDLRTYLKTLSSAADVDTAAYALAAKRFDDNAPDAITKLLTLSETLDNPMRDWVKTIALTSFKLLLSHARSAINRAWKNDVLPEYQRHIENRYPIFAQSGEDISFAEFTHFFGPHGTIETFFNSYLKPFVDISKNYWVWKKRDGITLGIPQANLEVLIRASLIQQMFFTDNHSHIFFKFALIPKTLSPNVAHYLIDVDGKTYRGDRGQHQPLILQWPNPIHSAATLQFIEKTGAVHRLHQQGAWAWFRLLGQARLASKDTESLEATFQFQRDRVRFQIIPDQQINPFIPNVISDFRCPEAL